MLNFSGEATTLFHGLGEDDTARSAPLTPSGTGKVTPEARTITSAGDGELTSHRDCDTMLHVTFTSWAAHGQAA